MEELCISVPATLRERERICRRHLCCPTSIEAEREKERERVTGIFVDGRGMERRGGREGRQEGRQEDGTAAVWASSLLARLLKVYY